LLLRKGQHEGLVSLATWKCVRERLTETPKAPFRKDIATDFPLRGFVRCADCCRPMTAAWSKGSTRSYPYYLCDTRGCVSYRKSIRRDLIEDGFAEIARTLPPSRNLLSIVRTVFRDLWETRLARTLLDDKHLKQRLDEIDTQSEAFLERIVATTAVPVISPYEKKIASLAEERPLLTEKLEHVAPTPERFEQELFGEEADGKLIRAEDAKLRAGADPNARNAQGVTFQRYMFMSPDRLLNARTRGERDAVAAWLRERQPRDWRPGIMHGDYHAANVMFSPTGPEVAAIVDWEMSTIGDPLLDLGWLLATWRQDDGSSVFSHTLTGMDGLASTGDLVERYAAGSSRDLSHIGWYTVMAGFKLAIVIEGTLARASAGMAQKEVGDQLHEAAVWLFDRAQTWMASAK